MRFKRYLSCHARNKDGRGGHCLVIRVTLFGSRLQVGSKTRLPVPGNSGIESRVFTLTDCDSRKNRTIFHQPLTLVYETSTQCLV